MILTFKTLIWVRCMISTDTPGSANDLWHGGVCTVALTKSLHLRRNPSLMRRFTWRAPSLLPRLSLSNFATLFFFFMFLGGNLILLTNPSHTPLRGGRDQIPQIDLPLIAFYALLPISRRFQRLPRLWLLRFLGFQLNRASWCSSERSIRGGSSLIWRFFFFFCAGFLFLHFFFPIRSDGVRLAEALPLVREHVRVLPRAAAELAPPREALQEAPRRDLPQNARKNRSFVLVSLMRSLFSGFFGLFSCRDEWHCPCYVCFIFWVVVVYLLI